MPTRFYLPSSGTPPLPALAVDAGWELTNGLVRHPCSPDKSDTASTARRERKKLLAWIEVVFDLTIPAMRDAELERLLVEIIKRDGAMTGEGVGLPIIPPESSGPVSLLNESE